MADKKEMSKIIRIFVKIVRAAAYISAVRGEEYRISDFPNAAKVADILGRQIVKASKYDDAFPLSEYQEKIVADFVNELIAAAKAAGEPAHANNIQVIAERTAGWMFSYAGSGTKMYDFFIEVAVKEVAAFVPQVEEKFEAPFVVVLPEGAGELDEFQVREIGAAYRSGIISHFQARERVEAICQRIAMAAAKEALEVGMWWFDMAEERLSRREALNS